MFFIFKPPQSTLQVILLDPDGPKQKDLLRFEEEYVAKLLLKRKSKLRRKTKQIDFKDRIKSLLEAGQHSVEITNALVDEIVSKEPQFEFTPEMQADVDRIVTEYKRQVAQEIRSTVVSHIQDIISEAKQLALQVQAEIDAIQLESVSLKLDLEQAKERARKKKRKQQRLKILLLLANLDDSEYD